MVYRELPTPEPLRDLIEAAWVVDGPREAVRVLPDGCMDLIAIDGRIVVAGPDTTASLGGAHSEDVAGLRFRPGVLPRLLGIPAAELRDRRIPLHDAGIRNAGRRLTDVAIELAARTPRPETSPWPLPALRHVTARFGAGASVARVAADLGWSNRTLQRQSHAVYGYGPATSRRILRFRRAVAMLRAGIATADVAARTGYADQPHLHRETRALSGAGVAALID